MIFHNVQLLASTHASFPIKHGGAAAPTTTGVKIYASKVLDGRRRAGGGVLGVGRPEEEEGRKKSRFGPGAGG